MTAQEFVQAKPPNKLRSTQDIQIDLGDRPETVNCVQSPLHLVRKPILHASEQIRRMSGGSQSQLMRCDDQNYYVVKFQNNPQGIQILVNELFAGGLAGTLQLPTPSSAIVQVDDWLIRYTDDLLIQLRSRKTRYKAGLQFGSQLPAYLVNGLVWDFMPDCELLRVDNVGAFAGMFAFDKWTCNTDSRQTIFVHSFQNSPFHALMIDNGFCFNGVSWNFPDAPRRSFYQKTRVYDSVTGIKSFEPWLSSIETMTEKTIRALASGVPPEWLDREVGRFEEMVGRLWRRRKLVRELIVFAVETSPEVFPRWSRPRNSPNARRTLVGRSNPRKSVPEKSLRA